MQPLPSTEEPPPPGSFVLVPVLLALLAWSGAVWNGGFAFDDREVVLENPAVNGALPWTAAFGRDYMHHLGDAGQYRPLATLSFALDHRLFGERSRGYHLTNLLLHALVVALGAACLRALVNRTKAPPTAGGLCFLGLAAFAVHPVLADSVAWIAGRTSLLSGLGAVLALRLSLCERRSHAFLGGLALLVALLAKEDALVVAPALLVCAARRTRGHAQATGAGLVIALATYAVLRAWALGSALPQAENAPLAALSLVERLPFGGRALWEAARLTVAPLLYPPNYRSATGFGAAAPAGPLAFAGLGVLVLAVVLGLRKRNTLPGVSLVLFALALTPLLQVAPLGEVFAPRFLYLPLLLATPFLGSALRHLPRFVLLGLGILAIALAWQRAAVYSGRAAYAEAVLSRVPTDARSWNDLGIAREEEGDPVAARAAWETALVQDPAYGRAYSNLARLALARGELDQAEQLLRRAVALGRANPTAHCNLGAVLLRQGNAQAAIPVYGRATELAPGMAAAWRGLGNALERSGQREPARSALERALELDPSDATTRSLLERLEG